MSDIVNCGICTVDIIGRPIDEAPPPGGLRLFESLTITTGGNATNCSIAMAKMGVPCDIIFVRNEAAKYRLGTKGLIVSDDSHTPFTFVCVPSHGERSFFHTMGTNGTLCYDDINLDVIRQARFCFITGTMVMKAFDGEQTARVLSEAQKAGVTTLLDTVYTDAASDKEWHDAILPCLPHLDYFIPSQPEARRITGQDDPSAMARFLQEKGCKNAVIKMDKEGAFCRGAEGTETAVPAYLVENIVDTTGAGDCWCAGFIVGLSRGLAMPEAAALGNAVAAHCIQAVGASTGIVPLGQIREFQSKTPTRT
jgi:sugar/nucleoside kinase (ribokinase family)